MSGAQVAFSIALGVVSATVVVFALFVASSTAWGDRWFRKR